MGKILEVKSVSKTYGNHKILNDVNMNIYKGDIYGFIGRNRGQKVKRKM